MHVHVPCREILPVIRRTGLDDDGIALWRSRHIQRTANLQVFARMGDSVDPLRICEGAGLAVKQQRFVFDAVPKCLDDI